MDGNDTGTNGPTGRHQHHPPPSYDLNKRNYTGISSGTLHTLGDLRDARDFAEMIVDTVREGLLVLDFNLRVVAANESFYKTFAARPETTVGKLIYDLGNGQWNIPDLQELLEGILPRKDVFDDYEVEHDFAEVGHRVVLLNARRLNDHQLILLAIEDMTERRKGERQLKSLNETLERKVEQRSRQVRELSRALALAEQEERKRIAYVLHEDLQQLLVGAKMVAQDVDRLREILDRAIDLSRSLSHELSPPLLQGEDLSDLLLWLAERKRELYGIAIVVQVGGAVSVPDPALRVLLYQLVREILFNVVKHAGTDQARLWAERADGHVRIVVEDDGAGFDPAELESTHEATGMGLPRVRERLALVGGWLEVASEVGQGTRVGITVPVRSA
jgi:signal transduction histidine kinase